MRTRRVGKMRDVPPAKVAVVQAGSVVFDLDASLGKLERLAAQASGDEVLISGRLKCRGGSPKHGRHILIFGAICHDL